MESPMSRNETATTALTWRNRVVPTCQPRSALKGPVLVPRARGFLMQPGKAKAPVYQVPNPPQCRGPSPSTGVAARMRSVRVLVAPVAGKLMPGNGELDEPLPVGTFGCGRLLHRGLSLMLWIVLGTHEPNFSRPIWTSGWQFRPYDCGVMASAWRAAEATRSADVARHVTHENVKPCRLRTAL